MALNRDPKIEELDFKLAELKREYDLFFAGQLRQEPLKLRREIERDIRMMTRSSVQSTVTKFQVRTLANRFRSLETQIRNITDLKFSRRTSTGALAKGNDSIIIDAIAITNPAIVARRIKTILKRIEKNSKDSGSSMKLNPDDLCNMLVKKAKGMVDQNNVKAVKFSIVESEGGAKVKGELITTPKQP